VPHGRDFLAEVADHGKRQTRCRFPQLLTELQQQQRPSHPETKGGGQIHRLFRQLEIPGHAACCPLHARSLSEGDGTAASHGGWAPVRTCSFSAALMAFSDRKGSTDCGSDAHKKGRHRGGRGGGGHISALAAQESARMVTPPPPPPTCPSAGPVPDTIDPTARGGSRRHSP
jgi:hypothetical protein